MTNTIFDQWYIRMFDKFRIFYWKLIGKKSYAFLRLGTYYWITNDGTLRRQLKIDYFFFTETVNNFRIWSYCLFYGVIFWFLLNFKTSFLFQVSERWYCLSRASNFYIMKAHPTHLFQFLLSYYHDNAAYFN